MPRTRHSLSGLFLIAILSAGDLYGQACQGTPRGRGFWVERGDLNLGNTIGAGGALGGKNFSISAGFRHRDVSDDITGDEATLRLGPVMRAGIVQLCPVLTMSGRRDEWQVDSNSTLTSTRAAAAAGVGVGIELPIIGDFSVVPHAIGQYEYAGTYYQIDSANEVEEDGTHSGRVDIEFGLLGRFRFFYGGMRTHWSPDSKYTYLTQWIAGVAF